MQVEPILGRTNTKSLLWQIWLQDQHCVRITVTPFDVLIRNELIVKAVSAHRGDAAGRLMRIILARTIEAQTSLLEERSGQKILKSTKCSKAKSVLDFVKACSLVEPANKKPPTHRKTALLPSDMLKVHDHSKDPHDHSYMQLFPSLHIIATKGLESSGFWHLGDKQPIHLIYEVLQCMSNSSDARDKFGRPDSSLRSEGPAETCAKRQQWLIQRKSISPGSMPSSYVLDETEWAADFASASEHLKVEALADYIKCKFGIHALRIWRIVDEKGMMEEKQVS